MGCFLGCFGFSSKRKRRKLANTVLPGGHRLGSYEPLDSVYANVDVSEETPNSSSELSKRPRETLNSKIRKKVSFNLNVQTYEPIPKRDSEDHSWGNEDEEEKKEGDSEETAKEGQPSCLPEEGNSIAKKMASYPPDYRYRNCTESYDEEDEIAFEESDFEDDEDEDDVDDCFGGIDDLRVSKEEWGDEFMPLSMSKDSTAQLAEDKARNLQHLSGSNEEGFRSLEMIRNARDRSQYVHSVLNPVENLSQWKAVKAGGRPPAKHQRRDKENAASEQQPQKPFGSVPNFGQSTALLQEVAVDASLSNWLVCSDSCQSRTTSMATNKGLFDSTHSWRNREDMPVLDITNLEA